MHRKEGNGWRPPWGHATLPNHPAWQRLHLLSYIHQPNICLTVTAFCTEATVSRTHP